MIRQAGMVVSVWALTASFGPVVRVEAGATLRSSAEEQVLLGRGRGRVPLVEDNPLNVACVALLGEAVRTPLLLCNGNSLRRGWKGAHAKDPPVSAHQKVLRRQNQMPMLLPHATAPTSGATAGSSHARHGVALRRRRDIQQCGTRATSYFCGVSLVALSHCSGSATSVRASCFLENESSWHETCTWLAVQLARRGATGATTMAMHRLRALAAHLVARPEPAAAAAAAAADATPNSPRGTAEQGFGIGWADRAPSDHVQPPVFDPSTELREACEFYAENGFVVVDALSAEECAEMNATADRFLEDTGDAALQEQSGGQGQLFYPLLGSAEDIDRYSAVDKYITHPRTLPVIADVLGGAPAVSAPHPPPPHHDHHDHPPPPQKE